MDKVIANGIGKEQGGAEATDSRCPRCHESFTCLKHDIVNCQCYAVSLSSKTRENLAREAGDCLCSMCLEKAELESDLITQRSFEFTKPVLVENLDYYMEGKNWVFTEFYHKRRGYCCKNNCRHCPYRG